MTGHHENDYAAEDGRREADAPRSTDVAGPRRYIALCWQLTATYHQRLSEAEAALAELPASQRAAIVDSQTGCTLASQASYPAVEAAVSGEVFGIMRRDGPLGDLAAGRRRRPSSPDHGAE